MTRTTERLRLRHIRSPWMAANLALATGWIIACGKTDNGALQHPPQPDASNADVNGPPQGCLDAGPQGLSLIVDRSQLELAVDETFGNLTLSACRLLFNTVATSSPSLGPPPIRSLWMTRGSPETTEKLGAGAEVPPLQAGEAVFYGVRSDGRLELWAIGDFAEPARKLHAYGGAERTVFKDALVFTGAESYPNVLGAEVWSSRGTPETTAILHDVNREAGSGSDPRAYTVVGERLYFIASEAAGSPPVVWQSDGVAATKVPGDLTPRVSAESRESPLFAAAPWLVFGGMDPSRNAAIWCVGDAQSPVRRLATPAAAGVATPASGVTRYATVAGTAFAFAQAEAEPRPDLARACPPNARDGLFRVDCDRETLALLIDTPTTTGCEEFRDIASTQGHACVVDGERHLWCSDGTLAGTRTIADGANTVLGLGAHVLWSDQNSALWSANPSSNAPAVRLAQRAPDSTIRRVGARAYFVGIDAAHGAEPWITDGTATGTRSIADIEPGSNGSAPRGFIGDEESVFFVAQRGGVEAIWRHR